MVNRVVDIVISTVIVVLVIYLMKWAFVERVQVPIVTDILKTI